MRTFGAVLLILGLVVVAASVASAHCDGMDGPVVKAAQKALLSGDVNYVLVWVQKADEGEIREAFEKTATVRKLSPEAKELADRFFFETLVRVHRAGEGAPYTGLKPAGRDLGPAIPAADRAIETGSVAPLETLLTEAVVSGIRTRFEQVRDARAQAGKDVEAGRLYVRAYVTFIHYVERLYEAARTSPEGHFDEADHAGTASHREPGGSAAPAAASSAEERH